MTTRLFGTLRFVADVLGDLDKSWALVGGLATSVYVEPRFTADIDIVVAVDDDEEAQEVLLAWRSRGLIIDTVIEQEATGRLATVRSYRSGDSPQGVLIDLLFASSGIESEVSDQARRIEIVEDLVVPVARPAHLFALKLLSVEPDDRPQDTVDLQQLADEIDDAERSALREALGLIERRGYSRGRDLTSLLDAYLE